MAQPIKVLYFIDNLDSGGTQRQLTLLLAGLDRSTVEPTLCTYQPARDFFLPRLRESGVRIVSIPKSRRLELGFVRKLVRFIRAEGFDLVHSFLRSANVWGCLAGRLARGPRVLASERRAVFDTSGPDHAMAGVVARLAHHVVLNSRFARRRLIDTLGVPAGKTSVIYNGIPQIAPPPPPPEQGIVFSMAATFVPNKNHRRVVEAFAQAYDRLPRPAVLQLIGNQEDGAVRRELERYLAGRPCLDAVRYLGRRNDVYDLFAASHCVVLASFNEAFPNVLLEALLCERPVLASDVCENPRIVGASERGWLFDPEDSAALAEAMVEVAATPGETRRALGRRGRRWVEENFSLERMVGATVALYSQMLGRP